MQRQTVRPIEEFIIGIGKYQITDREKFLAWQRRICKEHNVSFFKKDELLEIYKGLIQRRAIKRSGFLDRFLVLKSIRSLSGIVVVSLLTKPYACPGRCIYCPTEKNVPKSYLSREPAVMRAILCGFDPYIQFQERLKALKLIGHPISKINVRIIGGTWSYYPKQYQTWFIKEIYRAANEFGSLKPKNAKTLKELQKNNEKAKCRIVEISIETRPDFVGGKEIRRLRDFGVTKVELGVQSLDDKILNKNKRGHGIAETIAATKMLKDAGFKVAYQVMANMLGSNLSNDKKVFGKLFSDPNFKPDYLKIYPLALVKSSNLYREYKKGNFKPYTERELINLIKYAKKSVPYFARIERVIRDIPTDQIVEGGARISNLRQTIQAQLKKEGKRCRCIRCREVRDRYDFRDKPVLFREQYESSGGKDYFLSFENKTRSKLFSMLRLRIPASVLGGKRQIFSALDHAAIIREVHTYGKQIEVDQKSQLAPQHQGLGKRLIREAVKIAKIKGVKRMAVIAGAGARYYFRKLGFRLQDTYMVKKI
jgi:elongator complex protein 3